MILLWRPSERRLEQLLREVGNAPLTYHHVGATLTGESPAGFHTVRREIELGRGPEVFDRAGDAVLSWEVHRRSGMGVYAETPRVEPGRTVVTTVPVGPVTLAVPCRVVEVVRDDTRIGFAYGTLPGHPESGEEAFVIERRGDDVLFVVTAFSRAGGWLEWIGTPVMRIAQSQVTERYLRSLHPVVEEV